MGQEMGTHYKVISKKCSNMKGNERREHMASRISKLSKVRRINGVS
jgi:hypothetical protein